MPSIWNLRKYQWDKGMRMNFAGDSNDAYSVLMDSALGLLGAAPAPKQDFVDQVGWLHEYLTKLPAPKYPFPIDAQRAASGKSVFDKNCASCHASELTGKPLPLAEVGTDKNRMDSWNKQAAIVANKVVKDMGLERKGLVEEDLKGYVVASSTAPGCARRICTMARYRPCTICWNRLPIGRKFFIVVMTSTIRSTSAS
jgi:mono/diheme cytochrome c family protein